MHLRNSLTSIVPEIGEPTETAERGFTQLLIADLGPRLEALLRNVLGLGGVHLRQLKANYGVDLKLVGHKDYTPHPIVHIPIEVKRNFGQAPATGYFTTLTSIPVANFKLNSLCMERMAKSIGGCNPGNLLSALTQTAHYIEHAVSLSN